MLREAANQVLDGTPAPVTGLSILREVALVDQAMRPGIVSELPRGFGKESRMSQIHLGSKYV